jgi:spore maturation protein CgeB
MRLAVFGLTISSSWGNGHATLWRGLCKALGRSGHHVTFFERDRDWYANARDWPPGSAPGVDLVIYDSWDAVRARSERELDAADVAIVTSYCPDALAARTAILEHGGALPVFYDLDSPVTLARVAAGQPVEYLDDRGLQDYALVLSYAGGRALDELRDVLGAARTAPLYGHVDPEVHRPVRAEQRYAADLSWLGTYAADRQAALDTLFLAPARRSPGRRFLIAGAQYPADFPWGSNVWFIPHLPPPEHAAFMCSSRLTLNVTRGPMVRTGWCPSGRLFEAAACGAPVLTDEWPGLAEFYRPGFEVLAASDGEHTLEALALPDETLQRIGRRARERTLDEHTSEHRARELVALLEQAAAPARCHARPLLSRRPEPCGGSFPRPDAAAASNR